MYVYYVLTPQHTRTHTNTTDALSLSLSLSHAYAQMFYLSEHTSEGFDLTPVHFQIFDMQPHCDQMCVTHTHSTP